MKKNLISRIYENGKNIFLIGATIATFAVMPYFSGCESSELNYHAWKKNLSPEQREKQNQAELEILMQMNENEKIKREKELAILMQMNENEAKLRQQPGQNYTVKSQADKDFEETLDLYKTFFFGLGSDITFYEYQKRNP